jgi:hypothetical protein
MRMTTRVLAAVLPVLLTISTAAAAEPTPEKCEAGKLKALSKAQKANLNCYMKYHANPEFDISGCRLRFLEAFVIKLEKAGGSLCAGTYYACQTRIDHCPEELEVAALDGNSKCEGSKWKALGKYAASVLKCRAGTEVSACTDEAGVKLTAALLKAEEDGACAGTESVLVDAVTAHCIDKVAPAGDPIPTCEGCVDDGDCQVAEFCDAGLCEDVPCPYGMFVCDGDTLSVCAEDGFSSDFFATCTNGCDPGAPDRAACQCADDSQCYEGTLCYDGFCRNP